MFGSLLVSNVYDDIYLDTFKLFNIWIVDFLSVDIVPLKSSKFDLFGFNNNVDGIKNRYGINNVVINIFALNLSSFSSNPFNTLLLVLLNINLINTINNIKIYMN